MNGCSVLAGKAFREDHGGITLQEYSVLMPCGQSAVVVCSGSSPPSIVPRRAVLPHIPIAPRKRKRARRSGATGVKFQRSVAEMFGKTASAVEASRIAAVQRTMSLSRQASRLAAGKEEREMRGMWSIEEFAVSAPQVEQSEFVTSMYSSCLSDDESDDSMYELLDLAGGQSSDSDFDEIDWDDMDSYALSLAETSPLKVSGIPEHVGGGLERKLSHAPPHVVSPTAASVVPGIIAETSGRAGGVLERELSHTPLHVATNGSSGTSGRAGGGLERELSHTPLHVATNGSSGGTGLVGITMTPMYQPQLSAAGSGSGIVPALDDPLPLPASMPCVAATSVCTEVVSHVPCVVTATRVALLLPSSQALPKRSFSGISAPDLFSRDHLKRACTLVSGSAGDTNKRSKALVKRIRSSVVPSPVPAPAPGPTPTPVPLVGSVVIDVDGDPACGTPGNSNVSAVVVTMATQPPAVHVSLGRGSAQSTGQQLLRELDGEPPGSGLAVDV